ncbi:MAG: nucleotidyltransferase [Phaeodactylibacter sp.]|nr:nucleotidyltransferase [Phaeodactylibacter sp.]MCB9272864.1 nucleotidyltransferase [Lewinellaceae bacterium]
MKPTLLILAAGMGSRYGGLKQVDGVGPAGEAIIEYSIYDAIRAGFGKVVFVIRKDIEAPFREKFGRKFEAKIDTAYAFQEIDSLPDGVAGQPHREKPWGTGHAVLVAHDVVRTPFAVINADDYYGISGFETMARFLEQGCAPDRYSMIGYQLSNTLSEAGFVNRGICEVDSRGFLSDVVERHKIRQQDGGIFYEEDGGLHPLHSGAIVSMNFWGFHANIFDALRQQFIDFVEQNRDNPKSEFYIPFAVNELVQSGAVRLSVLPNDEKWYGVTYREDREMVEQAFQQLVKEGKYPAKLWEK